MLKYYKYKILHLLHLISPAKYKQKTAKYTADYKAIARSKLFDKKWYLKNNPDVAKSHADPIDHYLRIGWKEKRNPHPKFNGNKYLSDYPDIAQEGLCPLAHYVRWGKKEGRTSSINECQYHPYGIFYRAMRIFARAILKKYIQKNKKAKILVHLHLYYASAWYEIKEYLRNLSPYNYDLIVTYIRETKDLDVLNDIKSYKPDSLLILCSNQGFDIGPFFQIINNQDLSNYDIIYHLHTKSLAGRKGRFAYNRIFVTNSWFRQLFSGCLGVFNTHIGINALLNKPNTGIICAKNLQFIDKPYTQKLIEEYAKRLNVKVHPDYIFIGGSCCAYRANIVEKFKQLNINENYFETSVRSVFNRAHALERIMTIITLNAGYTIYGLPTLHNNHSLRVKLINYKKNLHLKHISSHFHPYGITDVKPFELNIHSGLLCNFFTGFYKKQKIFIKYGGINDIVQNEFEMQNLAHELLPTNINKVVIAKKEVPFIATEYQNGWNLQQMIDFGLSTSEKDIIINQLQLLKSAIAKWSYIHRDIRPANLIYDGKRLFLIDFQFMCKQSSEGKIEEIPYITNHPNIIKTLGKEYYNAANHQWNDITAIDKIIEEIKTS